MSKLFAKLFNLKVGVVIVILVTIILWGVTDFITDLDRSVYDSLLIWRNEQFGTKYIEKSSETPLPRVYVIGKDDISYKMLGDDWQRDFYAKAIRELTARGVKAIGIDFLLLDEKDPAKDAELVDTLKECGNVVLAQRIGAKEHFISGHHTVEEFREPPLEMFEVATGSDQLGMINTPVDADSVIRRYINFSYTQTDDTDFPHLATSMAALYLGGIDKIPDRSRVFNVNFIGGPESISHIPFYRAYNGELDRSFVEVSGNKLSRSDMNISLVPAGTSGLSGVVVDTDGNTVGEAMVVLINRYGYGTFITRSAADGTFAFSGLPPGEEFSLVVSTVGPDGLQADRMGVFGQPMPAMVPIDSEAGANVVLRAYERIQVDDVEPEAGGTVAVAAQVVSSDGMPVAGAAVSVSWTEQQSGSVFIRDQVTDDEGVVMFEQLPGAPLWVEVSQGEGWSDFFQVAGQNLSQWEPNYILLPVDMGLIGGAALEGVVVGEGSTGVEGMEVLLTYQLSQLFPDPQFQQMVKDVQGVVSTVSEAEGKFRIDGVGGYGGVFVWARAIDKETGRETAAGWTGLGELSEYGLLVSGGTITLQPDKEYHNAVVRLFPVSPAPLAAPLPKDGSIAGRVLDSDGAAVPNAAVTAYFTPPSEKDYPGVVLIKETKTNDRGEYAFDSLPPGNYYFSTLKRDDSGTVNSYGVTNAIDREWNLENAVVFIGPTSPVDQDLWAVPTTRGTESQMAGVEYHAHAFHSLVTNSCIHKPLGGMIPIYLFLPLGLALSWAFSRIQLFTGIILTGTTAVLLLTGALASLTFFHMWIETVPLLILTLLLFSTVYGYRFIEEQREKMRVRETFKRFVSPEVVNKILSTSGDIRMGGEKREMTVFFSDVRSFTTFSEHHTPEQIVECLNEYLNAMAEVIFKYEGTLDKFVGDEIMAVWGAPLSQPNHAELALRCCIEQGKVLEELWAKWEGEGREIMDMGMGLNTGPMITGAMGANMFMDYTVIGDAVNLGARLEGLTRDWDNYLIISEFTYEHVKDIVVAKPLEPVVVKGKTKPVMIYEIMGLKGEDYRFPLPRVAKKEKRELAQRKKAELEAKQNPPRKKQPSKEKKETTAEEKPAEK